MGQWIAHIAMFGLVAGGLGALALSQIGHFRKVVPHRPFPGAYGLRCGALLVLALSLVLSLASYGVAMGAVVWVLTLTLAGIGVALLLSCCPSRR
ncbi:DUF3325 family protein [Pseudomonas cedrina subsp. fulgida]|nr:DUF3325 family protein [Pseudomonas cedrina subsp. fulgida]